ncbi:MAG TPA: hypothetical protein VFH52_11365 [Rhodanobacteraceae bacterium]|nr:hypothetical protein [Rhodanobacteraceae bacterium]
MKPKGWFVATLALGLAGAATAARTAEFDVVGGASATAGTRWAPALFADVTASPRDDGHTHFEPIGSVGVIGSRKDAHENLDHTVFLVAGGLRYGREDGLFVSEQIAATSTRTDALSSRFEFMTSIGWRDGRWMVLLRHSSNAHILGGGRNLGETMLLAGVRLGASS